MKRGGRIAVLALLVLSACGDKNKLPPGFERIGGIGNVHFVYLDEHTYQGGKFDQMADARKICRVYEQESACEVYMWTEKRVIPPELPIRNRDKDVGWFRMREGKVVSFKQVHQQEAIVDIYDVQGRNMKNYNPDRVKHYDRSDRQRTQ